LVVKLVAVYVDEVAPAISLHVELLVDDCHWMVPVCPVKVITVELVPVQTVSAAPATVPPTDVGDTVNESIPLLVVAQTPLFTTAL